MDFHSHNYPFGLIIAWIGWSLNCVIAFTAGSIKIDNEDIKMVGFVLTTIATLTATIISVYRGRRRVKAYAHKIRRKRFIPVIRRKKKP